MIYTPKSLIELFNVKPQHRMTETVKRLIMNMGLSKYVQSFRGRRAER